MNKKYPQIGVSTFARICLSPVRKLSRNSDHSDNLSVSVGSLVTSSLNLGSPKWNTWTGDFHSCLYLLAKPGKVITTVFMAASLANNNQRPSVHEISSLNSLPHQPNQLFTATVESYCSSWRPRIFLIYRG